jgi:hypothetical protein
MNYYQTTRCHIPEESTFCFQYDSYRLTCSDIPEADVRNVDTSELRTEMAILPPPEAGMFNCLAQLNSVSPLKPKIHLNNIQFSYLSENIEQPVNAVQNLIHIDPPSAQPCIVIIIIIIIIILT